MSRDWARCDRLPRAGAARAADEPPAGTNRPPNRLARETSPYLLLHARNPVDWYPWGPEAFARAKAENKPIFLSIGYSSCYWCHVMERESFVDPEIARALNASSSASRSTARNAPTSTRCTWPPSRPSARGVADVAIPDPDGRRSLAEPIFPREIARARPDSRPFVNAWPRPGQSSEQTSTRRPTEATELVRQRLKAASSQRKVPLPEPRRPGPEHSPSSSTPNTAGSASTPTIHAGPSSPSPST